MGFKFNNPKFKISKIMDNSNILHIILYLKRDIERKKYLDKYVTPLLKNSMYIKGIDWKDNNFNKILIFEDDVTFRPTFPEMAKNFFDNLPSNWESVFIGANFQDGPYNFNPFVARGRAFGGQSYLLKSTVYDLIIDWGNNTANAPIDVFYANQLNPRDTNYFAAPQLCSQEQGKSDIEEKDVDHRGVLGGF